MFVHAVTGYERRGCSESGACLRKRCLFTKGVFVLKAVAVYKSDHCLRMGLFTKVVDVPKAVPVYERRACPKSASSPQAHPLSTKHAFPLRKAPSPKSF